jgi:hypothetical protein
MLPTQEKTHENHNSNASKSDKTQTKINAMFQKSSYSNLKEVEMKLQKKYPI